MRTTSAALLLVVLAGGAACSDGRTTAPPPAPPTSSPAPPAPAPSTAPSTAPPTAPTPAPEPQPEPATAVVTHATVPALRLTTRQAARLEAGRVRDWAQLGREPGRLRVVRTVRAVERDPAAVGVVPLAAVGPSVAVASVGGVDPVAADPRARTVTIAGDLMLVRGVPDARAALRPFRDRFRAADLAVANLESTLSLDGSPTQGGDSFGAPPSLRRLLVDAGLDGVSLANNHTGDYGERALRQTVAELRRGPVRGFGAGRDLAEASRPLVLEAGGTRWAFVGFNAIGETPQAAPGTPGALSVRMPPRTGPLQEADLRHVESVVRRAARTADAVVVLPHWGAQYTHEPDPAQRVVARRLVAAGADLVVGGHPHWVQGVEQVGRVPVLHSLGNFVFDMGPAIFPVEARQGVVAETTWWGGELKQLRLVPYRMSDDRFVPRPLPAGVGEGADILADVWSTSRGPWAPR